MAKIYGLFGTMTGKLADTVMSVRNGEQIARKYQPVVLNPSSPAQVAQRAKLKLMSQLSAIMAPVIAIPRQGAVSSRNLFTKKNIGLTTYANNEAEINMPNIQLTSSVVGLPALVVGATGTTSIDVSLDTINVDIDRVVYAAFEKRPDNSLRLYGTTVVSERGTSAAPFGGSFPYTSAELVVYAYGVRDNNENARTTFGNLEVTSGEQVAKLITNRKLTEADITLTETVGRQFIANP